MNDEPFESSSNGTSQKAVNHGQLIESIYRIALEPQTYDAFIGRWDDFIQDRLGALDALRGEDKTLETTEIAAHFGIAERLLEQTRKAGEAQHLAPAYGAGSASRGPDPQFLVDASGMIVWSNAAATRLFAIERTTRLQDLALPERYKAALAERVNALDAASDFGDPPLIIQIPAVSATDGCAPGNVIHLQAQRLQEEIGGDLMLVSPLAANWPPGMPGLLAATYGLSQSECEICELLSRAHRPAGIAGFRGSTIATVRTQIKSLLLKTGCGSQTELVRLLHLLMRVAESHGPSHPASPIAQGEMITLQLDCGILMPVEMHGPTSGRPVIFLHGMLDGASLTRRLRDALGAHGYRFVCPTRPWFGDAEPDYGAIDTAPQRVGAHVREMCIKLDLEDAVVLGHMAGAVYAFASAAAAPEHIRAVLNVAGGVPIVSGAQFSDMSRRQRVVAYTARYTPRLLPFVLRAGISQIRSGGTERFMQSLYATAPIDMAVLEDREIRRIVLHGYQFATRQGHHAFEIDGYHVVRNWEEIVAGSDVPVKLLHGVHDPVVRAGSVHDFVERLGNRASLEMFDDAGQLLLHQFPERVLDALSRI